ncbi:MAG: biotin/lipoyl-binding protein [Planctomycetes bacterium]|nr:biotin/lipoyl-binding protein [Planctomycetota bacterium]
MVPLQSNDDSDSKSAATKARNQLTNRGWGILPLRNHAGTMVVVFFTLAASAAIVWYVVRPTYMHPSNRTYTSGMGYPAILRAQGKPFPVTTGHATERVLNHQFLGEGIIETEPVRVPIVPEGRVARVLVEEGDHVKRGQVLAELDTSVQESKIAEAKNAIDAAAVQVERARVGSVYGMQMERPEIVRAQLELAKKQVKITSQLVEAYGKLQKQNVISAEAMLQQELAANQALATLSEAEQNTKISQAGRPLSVQAAELALQEARLKHKVYTRELEDFKIRAIADGMVAQVLIHEGEYNRNIGTSAFVLAVGQWFGGNFDQTTMGRFPEGAPVHVRLEAFPGRVFEGRVRKVKPMVTYNSGGPEAARPIRPMGTGSPEWPATFTTRIELVAGSELPGIVPGLTGFAEVKVERRGTAVPDGSLTSVAAGRAIAYVVEGDKFHAQQVAIAQASDGWIEILSGLTPGTEIIVDGHQILRPGDRILGTPAKSASSPANEKIARPAEQPNKVAQGIEVVTPTLMGR